MFGSSSKNMTIPVEEIMENPTSLPGMLRKRSRKSGVSLFRASFRAPVTPLYIVMARLLTGGSFGRSRGGYFRYLVVKIVVHELNYNGAGREVKAGPRGNGVP